MTLGSHQRVVGKSQVHITPRWIVDVLGPFDLDPCAADPRPWSCANANYTEADNGLRLPWCGRIWLNPPFHRYQVGHWIARLAQHGRGTALLHARTEAGWFKPVWECGSAILFMSTRVKFFRSDGSEQPGNSGAPPVLVAFGDDDARRLRSSAIRDPLSVVGPGCLGGQGTAAVQPSTSSASWCRSPNPNVA